MHFSVESPEAVAELHNTRFMEMDARLAGRLPLVVDYTKEMSERQVQWGKVAGLNSGNGQLEAIVPAEVFVALSSDHGPFREDPDWWKDDKKFYRWLRDHKQHDARPGKHSS